MTSPFVKSNRRYTGPGWFNKPGIKVIGIPSGEAFGNHVVGVEQKLTVPSIPSAEALGAIMLAYNQFITAPGIASAEAVGTPSVSVGPVNIAVPAIDDGITIGTPTVSVGPVGISPAGIASGEAFGSPVVTNPANLVFDPTFEGTLPAYTAGTSGATARTTEEAHSGTKSLKITVAGSSQGRFYTTNNMLDQRLYELRMAVGELLYIEYWVKKNAANTGPSGFGLHWYVQNYDEALTDTVYISFTSAEVIHNANTSTEWEKKTLLYRHMDAARPRVMPFIQANSAATLGDSWYIDDIQIIKTQEVAVPNVDNIHFDPFAEKVGPWNGAALAGSLATVSVSNDVAYQGLTSIKWERTSATDAYMFLTAPIVLPPNTVTPGDIVNLEVAMYAPTVSTHKDHRLFIRWRDSTATLPNIDVAGPTVTLVANTWGRLSVKASAPKGYDTFYVYWRPNPVASPAIGSIYYFDNFSIDIERINNPSVDMVVSPLQIIDDSELATDPQILRPELWKTVAGSNVTTEFVIEDGFTATRHVKNVAADVYPNTHPIRLSNGLTGPASIVVSPGDRIKMSCTIKPLDSNVGTNKIFIQTAVIDSNAVNPTVYSSSGAVARPKGQWTQLNIDYVVPAGYNRISSACYMIHLQTDTPMGDGWFIKEWHYEIIRTSDHVISTGPVDISVPALDDGNTVGTPTISSVAFVAPSGISSGEAVGTPAMQTAQGIFPAGLDDGNLLGTHAISVGDVNLSIPAIDDGITIGTPTIVPGPVNLAPAGIDDGNTIGTPTISVGPVNISIPSIDDGDTIGNPLIIPGTVDISPTGIDDGNTIGTPEISRDNPLSFIGAVSYNSTNGALPPHLAGDGILAIAGRDGDISPTLPGGWNQLFTGTMAKLAYKIAASSSETSGTWTNANGVSFAVYRPGVGFIWVVPDEFDNASQNANIFYPEFANTDLATFVRLGAHRGATNLGANTPSGWTNRTAARYTRIMDSGDERVSVNASTIGGNTESTNSTDWYRSFTVRLRVTPQ